MLHPTIKCSWGKDAQGRGLISHGSFYLVVEFLLVCHFITSRGERETERDMLEYSLLDIEVSYGAT